MTERAYCRVYYSVKDDPKFETIFGDNNHLATWLRLLMAADAIWPASPDLPGSARKASVQALVSAELVDLLPMGMYRIRGLDAERGARRDAARVSAGHRTPSERSPNAHRTPTSHSEPSQAEPSQAEPSQPPARRNGPEPIAAILPDLTLAGPPEDAYGISEDEHRVFAFLARYVHIRPDSGYGRRLLQLIERRGVEDVLRHAGIMAKGERLSDRQWVFGLEAALEAVPGGKEAKVSERAEDEARAHQRRLEATRQKTAAEREALIAQGRPS